MNFLGAVLVGLCCAQLSNAFPFFHLSRSAQKEIPNSVLGNGATLNNANAVGSPMQQSAPSAAAAAPASPASSMSITITGPQNSNSNSPPSPDSGLIDISVTANKDGPNALRMATEATPNMPKLTVEDANANKQNDLYGVWNPVQYKDLEPVYEQTTVSEIWKDINRVLSGDIPQSPRDPAAEEKNNIESPAPLTLEFELEHPKTNTNNNNNNQLIVDVAASPANAEKDAQTTLEFGFQHEQPQPMPQALPQVQPLPRVRKLSVQENPEHFLTGNSIINAPNSLNYIRLKKLNDTYNDFVDHLHSVLEKNRIVYEKQLQLLKSIDHPYIVNEINTQNAKGENGRPWYMKYFDMGEQAMEWAQEKSDTLQKKLELYKEKLQEISTDLQYGDYFEPRSMEKQNEHVYDGYFKVF